MRKWDHDPTGSMHAAARSWLSQTCCTCRAKPFSYSAIRLPSGTRVPRSLWCGDAGRAQPRKDSLSTANSALVTFPGPSCHRNMAAQRSKCCAMASSEGHLGESPWRSRIAGAAGRSGGKPHKER